jgi:hypothetical protein
MVSESNAQHFIKVGRRVSRNKQYNLARIGEFYCRRAGHRCFANAPFAREEKIARWVFKEFHD